MARMSGARALIEALKWEEVDTIFGIPGGAILPVYDELYESGIRHILARHEQCAAHMAEGYARASGKVGVCMATSGPGATNLLTGIANAHMDSSPLVAFTGQVPRNFIGKDAFQEADITGMATPVTKHNFLVMSAREIPSVVKAAFHIASTGRPGPVLVDIPKDVQVEEDEMVFEGRVELAGYKPNIEPHILQVKKAAELMGKAERPVILAGGGVKISQATNELVTLAERLGIPVATSFMGKGCIPENHPLFLGVIGMHGAPQSNKLINEADVLLAVGVRFSDRTTGAVDEFVPDAKIIHVDIDPSEIGKNKKVAVPIVGDVKRTLKILTDLTVATTPNSPSAWIKKMQELKEYFRKEDGDHETPLKPPRLLRILRRLLPKDAIATTEVGQNQMWASLYFEVYSPRSFITSGGLGTMGFGFPAALGAKVARPEVPVVDIAGDGSFIMTEQELATSIEEDIPVIVVVLNNRMLGMVAQWQRLFYKRRYSGVKMGQSPDFVKLAEAYGAVGVRTQSYAEFEKAISDALKAEVTTVLDVPISPDENVFPMVPPGKRLDAILLGM